MKKSILVSATLLCMAIGCSRRIAVSPASEPLAEADSPVGELRITVRTIPEITGRKEEDFRELTFPPVEGLPVKLDVDSSSPIIPIVSQNREFTYTIWLTKWELRKGSGKIFWSPEIATIEDEGKIIYNGGECPMHHTQMNRGSVEIYYGFPDPNFMQAMDAQFSGGPGLVLGGCCVGPVKSTFGFKCDECISAYEKWQSEYSKIRDKDGEVSGGNGGQAR